MRPMAAATQISAIIITARDGDADLAARIANDFAQGVLDMSSSAKLARARDTPGLLPRGRGPDFRPDRRESRSKWQPTRTTHGAALPSVTDARRDELVGLESDMRALDQALVALLEEQRQLAARRQSARHRAAAAARDRRPDRRSDRTEGRPCRAARQPDGRTWPNCPRSSAPWPAISASWISCRAVWMW